MIPQPTPTVQAIECFLAAIVTPQDIATFKKLKTDRPENYRETLQAFSRELAIEISKRLADRI